MSMFSRFFGGQDGENDAGGKLVSNPAIEKPLSLQVLFSQPVRLDCESLLKTIKGYHRSMAKARCEMDPELNTQGNTFGMVGWGKHVIRFVGFDLPMPADAVESCVAPSHYPEELKQKARAHQAHVILYYGGYEESAVEQYVALTAVAGVLASFGALVILNESGHTSFPAAALSGEEAEGDRLELLRTLPLPILYCGFVKHEVADVPGVWMRTYGAPLMGLPDLAAHAEGHHEGERYFQIFDNVFGYLLDAKAQLAAGHTMQIEEDEYLRFRDASEDEEFLVNEGALLVVEIIGADEINK
jgi:hypothetical protein